LTLLIVFIGFSTSQKRVVTNSLIPNRFWSEIPIKSKPDSLSSDFLLGLRQVWELEGGSDPSPGKIFPFSKLTAGDLLAI
jgi:hypothetical protein